MTTTAKSSTMISIDSNQNEQRTIPTLYIYIYYSITLQLSIPTPRINNICNNFLSKQTDGRTDRQSGEQTAGQSVVLQIAPNKRRTLNYCHFSVQRGSISRNVGFGDRSWWQNGKWFQLEPKANRRRDITNENVKI